MTFILRTGRVNLLCFFWQAEDVRVLLMDAMASKSQVIQIPATKAQATPSQTSIAISPTQSSVSAQSAPSPPPSVASSTALPVQSQQISPPIQPPVLPRQPSGVTSPVRHLPIEVKKQHEGMTASSSANKNLLLSEPCNVDGLPTKRLRDQAEGLVLFLRCVENSLFLYFVII